MIKLFFFNDLLGGRDYSTVSYVEVPTSKYDIRRSSSTKNVTVQLKVDWYSLQSLNKASWNLPTIRDSLTPLQVQSQRLLVSFQNLDRNNCFVPSEHYISAVNSCCTDMSHDRSIDQPIPEPRVHGRPMNRWRGKTAVVTGAASGIGEAITDILLEEGINVAAFDVQYDRLKKKEALLTRGETHGKLFPVKCDLRSESEILDAFNWVKKNLGGVDIMVNNAGVMNYSKVIESETEAFRKLLDVNLLAVAICTREAVSSMRTRDVEGHIFNINSILGHEIPHTVLHKGWNLYPSCKHATVAMTSIVRRELIDVKAKIRMTSISPGLVKTEIAFAIPELKHFLEGVPALLPSDVADAVTYVLGTRPEVQITELTIGSTGEP